MVNFDVFLSDTSSELVTRPKGDTFPWCGFLIDTHHLTFCNDYSRYEGDFISDSITAERESNPGIEMRNKLLCFVRPRLHALILNPLCAPRPVALRNVYQESLLTACKFVCLVRSLPNPSSPPLAYLERVLSTLASLFTAHTQSAQAHLRPCDVSYLFTHAFAHVLRRKHCRFAALLTSLNTHLAQLTSQHTHRCCALCPPTATMGLLTDWLATTSHKSNQTFHRILL